MGKSEPYDGILTADFFAQYDIDFDFSGKQISFLTPTNCGDPNGVVLWQHTAVAIMPMTLKGGKISVPVMINGHDVNAVIDTSSARTVMRRDIAETVFGLKADTADATPDGDAGMAGQQVYRHTFPQISFEGMIANNVPVRIQTNSMVHKINRTPILGSRAQFASDAQLAHPRSGAGHGHAAPASSLCRLRSRQTLCDAGRIAARRLGLKLPDQLVSALKRHIGDKEIHGQVQRTIFRVAVDCNLPSCDIGAVRPPWIMI